MTHRGRLLGRLLGHRLLVSVLMGIALTCGAGAARASSGYQVIEISVGGRSHSEIMRQAEQLARDEVLNQFTADPQLSEIKVDVLGQRNGQVVPILSVQVSRQQWQGSPWAETWTQYYGASYGLLNPDGNRNGADQLAAAPVERLASAQADPSAQLDAMLRQRRISYEDYIELVDALD